MLWGTSETQKILSMNMLRFKQQHHPYAVDPTSVNICTGFNHTSTKAAATRPHAYTNTCSVHHVTLRHTASGGIQSHRFVVGGLFGLLKHVLHVGKIKVAASSPTENIKNISARCFKVARGIVARRHINLLLNENKQCYMTRN